MKKILLIITSILAISAQAQVGVGTTSPQAMLDVSASDPFNPVATDGVLVPRVADFPVTDPGVSQDGLLIYVDNAAAPFGKGFYYWDDESLIWRIIGTAVWVEGSNGVGEENISSYKDDYTANDVFIGDNAFVGFGTDSPTSELEIAGVRAKTGIEPELIIENTLDAAEILISPQGPPNRRFTLAAEQDAPDGLKIYQQSNERAQVKTGGDLRIDNLSASNNAGIAYPASLYVEADGTVQTATAYSRLDDVKEDLKNFSSSETCETITPFAEAVSPAFYTYTVTPTEDTLLEISYHVGANLEAFGGGLPDPKDTRHNSKIYGVYFAINGVDFTKMAERMTMNQGIKGYFHISDHLYMPLVADGTTYVITMKGFVQNDSETDAGIRGTFGGDADDRIQIIEHI